MARVTVEVTQLIQECINRPGTGEAFVEQSRHALRHKCKMDPWFFLYYVLGYKDIDTDLHRDMIYRWMKRRNRLFTLWQVPRGHLKTSIWTIGMNLWELIQDPNLRILIVNAVYQNALDIMSNIAQHLTTNDVFRWMFPEYCPDLSKKYGRRNLITSGRIDLPCGNRVGKQEGNVECMGVEMSLVSMHYDILHYDDMMNDVNTATSDYRNKGWTWFRNSWQLRHSPSQSRIRVVGTPWHLDDSYSRIIKGEMSRRQAGRAPKWLLYRRAAVEDSQAIWPERFPLSVLEDLQNSESGVGSYIFACQYMCNPISPESSLFKEEDIQIIDEEDLPDSLINFAAVDLSEEGDDYTVVVVASVDTEGKLYVRQIVRGHIRPLELIDTIHSLNNIWKLEAVGIETVGFQKSVYKFYKDYSADKSQFIRWKEMVRGKTHKIRRFLSLQPLLERKYFFAVKDIANLNEMISEMVSISFDHLPSHDDITDCVSDIYQLSYDAPRELEEVKAPRGSVEDLFGPLDDDEAGSNGHYKIGAYSWRNNA